MALINITYSADEKTLIDSLVGDNSIVIGGNVYVCKMDAYDSSDYTLLSELNTNDLHATTCSITYNLNAPSTLNLTILGTDNVISSGVSYYEADNENIIAIYKTNNDASYIKEIGRFIITGYNISDNKMISVTAQDYLWSLFCNFSSLGNNDYNVQTWRTIEVIKLNGERFTTLYNVETETPPAFFGDTANKFAEVRPLSELKVYPYTHGIIKVAFDKKYSNYIENIDIGIQNTSLQKYDSTGKTPGQVISEIANMVGAYIKLNSRVSGGTKKFYLEIIEYEFSNDNPVATYNQDSIISCSEIDMYNPDYNSIVVRGKNTPIIALRKFATNIPFDEYPNFTNVNGYELLASESGTYTPTDTFRDTPPEPLEYYLTVDSNVYDINTLEIVGNAYIIKDFELFNDGTTWGQIVLGVPIDYYDLRLSPPYYISPINGQKIYRIKGNVVDSTTGSGTAGVPIKAVRVKDASGNIMTSHEEYTTTSTKTGGYSFENVPLGEYRIIAPYLDTAYSNYYPNIVDNDFLNDSYRNLIDETEYWNGVLDGDYSSGYQLIPTNYNFEIYIQRNDYSENQNSNYGNATLYQSNIGDTAGGVLVEIRLAGTADNNVRYAPLVESDNITSEQLAIHIGEYILKSSQKRNKINHITAIGDENVIPGEDVSIDSDSVHSSQISLVNSVTKTLNKAKFVDDINLNVSSFEDIISRINGLSLIDNIEIGTILQSTMYHPDDPKPDLLENLYDIMIYKNGKRKILTNVRATGDRRFVLNQKVFYDIPQYTVGQLVIVTKAKGSNEYIIIGNLGNKKGAYKIVYV